MRRKKQQGSKEMPPADIKSKAPDSFGLYWPSNRQEVQKQQQEPSQDDEQQVVCDHQIVNDSLIIMKMMLKRGRQVLRVKLIRKTSIMQLFILVLVIAISKWQLQVSANQANVGHDNSTITNQNTNGSISLELGLTIEPDDISALDSTSTQSSLTVESTPSREQEPSTKITTTTPTTTTTTTTKAPETAETVDELITRPANYQEAMTPLAPTVELEEATTVSSFSLSEDGGDNLVITSEYQDGALDGTTETSSTFGLNRGPYQVETVLKQEEPFEPHASLEPEVNETPAISQLVRSRKSSPEDKSTSNSSSLTRQTTTTMQSLSAANTQVDYDEFDLDYPIRMSGASDGGEQKSQVAQNLTKRDYNNNQHEPTPPPWSVLLGGDGHQEHLFSSSLGTAINNDNSTGLNETIPARHYYHNSQPIMPSLLTVKSAPLTSQELNKVRPHFLFYPDQYNELNEPNAYSNSAGTEALANGDLLATATNINEHKQRLPIAFESPSVMTRNFTTSLPSIDSSLQAFATIAANADGKSSNGATNAPATGKPSVQTISLLNGSPVANRSADLLENLSTSGLMQMPKLTDINATQRVAPTSQKADESPQVTTIVVDNSTPSTESPVANLHGYYHAQKTTTSGQTNPLTTTPVATAAIIMSPTSVPATSSTQTSRSSGTGSSAQQTANSSQSHGQWFNYPHPNLHHNPLLLHHILNKPSSFYAKAQDVNSERQQTLPMGSKQPVASTEAPRQATTTISSFMPQIVTSLGAKGSSPSQMSMAPTGTINIIERPTYSASSGDYQRPINMTLLQMQLNEMRAIAAKSNAINAKSISPQHKPKHLDLMMNRDRLVNGLVQSALVQQQQANNNLRFISQPQTKPNNLLTTPRQQLSTPTQEEVLQHLLLVNSANGNHPQASIPPVATLRRPPLAPLASQIIAAPSLLQEVHTLRPYVKTAHTNQNLADSLSTSASSMTASNSSFALSDEDMSTYVALLASLNNGTPHTYSSHHQEGSGSIRPEMDKNERPNMGQINTSSGGTRSAGQQMSLREIESSFDSPQQLHLVNQKNAAAGAWQTKLLKDARIVGLSDEVQAKIYRDYLEPLMGHSKKTPSMLKSASTQLTWPPPFVPPSIQMLGRPSAESSNALRTFSSVVSHAPPTSSPYPTWQPHSRPSMGTGEQRNYYTLDGQSVSPPPTFSQQHQQVAFIEALRTTLARLHEAATGNSEQAINNNTKLNSSTPNDLDFDENLVNSNSRPISDWLDSSQVAQSLYESPPSQAQNPYKSVSNFLPTGWLSSASHMSASAVQPTMFSGPGSFGRPAFPSRFPIPIYPLRSLFGARQYGGTNGALSTGPQPRLLWPVHPASTTGTYATIGNAGGHLMTADSNAQPVTPVPLVRLNPGVSLPFGHQHLQPPSMSLAMTPNKILLDRFPLTAAPAYLVKLPTLTGGTITASGSLVAPQKFSRGRPPAAFISTTPLGALRFLNALTPPRMRLLQAPLPPPPTGLQQAPSIVHVQHGPSPEPAHYPAHLHPLPHFHHQQEHHHLHSYHAQPQPSSRLQINMGSSLVPPFASQVPNTSGYLISPSASTSSHLAIENTSKQSIDGGSHSTTTPASAIGSSSSETSGGSSENAPTQQPSTALTRLQAATASLVELTSLASLIDEMVGGSDIETSPAVALANAISSLSAAQNAAALSAQASASGETATRLPSSINPIANGQLSSGNRQLAQPQMGPASIWRNLFMPNLWRQNSAKLNGATSINSNRFRDISALERLLSHAALVSASPQSARLKVKYIRVPVAVYETGSGKVAPNIGDQSLQLTTLGGGSQLDGGLVANQQSKTQTADLTAPSGDNSIGSTQGGVGSNANSATSHATQPNSGGSLSQGAGGSGSSDLFSSNPTASSSNDYLFDEMSSESGPQLNYVLSSLAQEHHEHERPNGLGYLPIVRAVPKALHQLRSPAMEVSQLESPYYAFAQASMASSQVTTPAVADESEEEGRKLVNEKKTKQKRKEKKKGKRKKSKKLFGGSDNDDDDDIIGASAYNHLDDNGDDDEEDDDAITANDLPIIESLISTLIHGTPASMANTNSGGHQQLYGGAFSGQPTTSSSWRSPFSPLKSRARFLTPEASSNVLAYAHPVTGLPISAPPTSGQRSIFKPFNRQRFSLGEVVGALGAKRLVSSLLGRRKEARTKRVAAAGAVVTPATFVQMASTSGRSPNSLNAMRKNLSYIAWPKAPKCDSKKQRLTGKLAGGCNSTSSLKDRQMNSNATQTLADELQGFVLGDNNRPLVYPPIAAYESDSFMRRPSVNATISTSRRPQIMRREYDKTSALQENRTLNLMQRPDNSQIGSKQSLPTGNSQQKMSSLDLVQASIDLPLLASSGTSPKAKAGPLEDSKPVQPARSIPQSNRLPGEFAANVRRDKVAMPLYHVVADHYNKLNVGHQERRPETSNRPRKANDLDLTSSSKDGKISFKSTSNLKTNSTATISQRSSRIGTQFYDTTR